LKLAEKLVSHIELKRCSGRQLSPLGEPAFPFGTGNPFGLAIQRERVIFARSNVGRAPTKQIRTKRDRHFTGRTTSDPLSDGLCDEMPTLPKCHFGLRQ
jgi:hypothetical protein